MSKGRVDWSPDGLMMTFPRGAQVRKSALYPAEWRARDFCQSDLGVVVGYTRSGLLRVHREGTVAPLECDPCMWELATTPTVDPPAQAKRSFAYCCLTSEEYDLVKRFAKREKLSISAFVRMCINQWLLEEGDDVPLLVDRKKDRAEPVEG